MSDNEIRVALLGYGLAGRWFHAPLIRSTPRMRIVQVVTNDPERARQVSADLPEAAVLADATQVFAEPDDADLVVVATANVVHVDQALAALGTGRHVVVDKPVAGTVTEVDQLIAAAGAAQRHLMVFQNRRWDADYLTVRRLIADGEIGAVHRWESRFERWRPQVGGGWRESADPAQVGGVMLDLGAHLIDQALHALGPATSVYAERRCIRVGGGSDDDAFVAVQHRDGAVSHHWMSAVAADLGPRLRILGDAGALTVDGLDRQEDALRSGRLPDAGWGIDDRQVVRSGGPSRQRHPMDRGDWPAFYRQVAAALLDGADPPVPITDVRHSVGVLQAAVESAASGGVVPVG